MKFLHRDTKGRTATDDLCIHRAWHE